MKPTSKAFAILGGLAMIGAIAGLIFNRDDWGWFLAVSVVLILAVR